MLLTDDILQKYNSVTQIKAFLADTQNLIGELGRGSGKTTEILAPRLIRVTCSMPRSIVALAGPTYTFVIDTIVPGILTYLNKYYIRGKHFEYGKQPPNFFKRPYVEITKWKHTFSFPWGTVVKFAGIDRPDTSLIGQNIAHIFIDELLRINETNFTERLMPAQRGDRSIFGNSPYFGGITGFSSTPNFENDHDWWLSLEENMDEALIEEIMYVAYRSNVAAGKAQLLTDKQDELKTAGKFDKVAKNEIQIKKLTRFVQRWNRKLNEKRKGATYYMKGSSFTNLLILGLDYMKNQYKGSKHNIEKFKLVILGIRPDKVKNMFFSKFSPKNIFEDSYTYNQIDLFDMEGEFKKTSRDLKYCDTNKPLLMGLDPGNFMSCVFAQEKGKTLNLIKNMYVITPDQHFELAQKINTFFHYHNRKSIYLYYDRAGNKRLDKYKGNPKGDTDAKILKRELEDLGWTVHLMSTGQRTIFYWQHYLLFARLFSEREKTTPRMRICQNECEELISSIYMSPLKRTEDNMIILDKSSEKKLDYEDQAFWSTQIASALMYLLYGLYEKYLPDASPEMVDFEGL